MPAVQQRAFPYSSVCVLIGTRLVLAQCEMTAQAGVISESAPPPPPRLAAGCKPQDCIFFLPCCNSAGPFPLEAEGFVSRCEVELCLSGLVHSVLPTFLWRLMWTSEHKLGQQKLILPFGTAAAVWLKQAQLRFCFRLSAQAATMAFTDSGYLNYLSQLSWGSFAASI